MNRRRSANLLVVVATITALVVVTATSASACKRIKPKTWTGSFEVVDNFSVTYNYITQSHCQWNGLEPVLNGFDALVFKVTGYGGLTAVAKWSSTSPLPVNEVIFTFANGACRLLQGIPSSRHPNTPLRLRIPPTAKWMFVTATPLLGAASGLSVSVHSAGRTCPRRR